MSKLYNGKWDGIWDKPKYQMIRDKIENAFKGIEFIEETHQYFYKGIELIPTSNVCHAFRLGFDEDSQAERCSLKYFNDPNNKYYQMTKEEILESWHANSKRATDHGTKIHLFGENCAYFMMKRYDRLTEEFKCRIKKEPDGKEYVESAEPKEEAIVRFWNDLPVSIVPILFEVQMFDLSWGVSGTADLLFVYDPHIESDNNYEELRTRMYLMDYKGLPLDTPILTTNGWKTMGTLEEGEYVYDKDGKPSKILHTSEIHNNPCYKITFDNGDDIIADHEHRWLVSFRRNKERYIEKVMTTEEISNYLLKCKKGTYYIPKIKVAAPIVNEKADLPIDPYVFGVWLGDGNSYSGHITNMYQKLWNEIEARGYSLGNDVSQGHSGKAQTRNVVGMITQLKKLGVLGNKCLPDCYINSSTSQRLDVLRGLMDTDGYYNKARNRFVMTTTKEWQVDAMVKLLSSLGVKATVIKTYGKCNNFPNKEIFEKYDVTFYMNENPFLIRDISFNKKNKNKYEYRNIISVEKTETISTRCIEVDSISHTYLCGRNFLVTHNTNADLYKSFGNMLPPFDELPDNDLGGYKIQAGIYSHFIMNLGFEFVARALIWLKDTGEYEKVKMESFTGILRNYLKLHTVKELLNNHK